jgi:hypothetical protein
MKKSPALKGCLQRRGICTRGAKATDYLIRNKKTYMITSYKYAIIFHIRYKHIF